MTAGVNWRFFEKLSLSLSSEIVRREETEEQDVLSVSYLLSRDRTVGGRLVRTGGHTNFYLSFSRSGYGGTEYFVILGDPNTESFKSRLIFKVVKQI